MFSVDPPWMALVGLPCAIKLPSDRFHVNLDDESDLLGTGRTHQVFKAQFDGKLVAAKRLQILAKPDEIQNSDEVRKLYQQGELLDNLMHEVQLHNDLSGKAPPELVKFYGICWEERHGIPVPTWIIVEYCEGGTLKHRLQSRGGELLPRERIDICRALLRCLQYLHAKNIIHRDIRPANILFGDDGRVKLADLGYTRAANRSTMTTCSTPLYRAPEVERGHCDVSVDLYSLAVMTMEMHGKEPASEHLLRETQAEDLAGEAPHFRTILQCITHKKGARPDIKKIKTSFCQEGLLPVEYDCRLKGRNCSCRDEPVASQAWVWCQDCGACFHATCFESSHALLDTHRGYLLPCRYQHEFAEVQRVSNDNVDIVLAGSEEIGLTAAVSVLIAKAANEFQTNLAASEQAASAYQAAMDQYGAAIRAHDTYDAAVQVHGAAVDYNSTLHWWNPLTWGKSAMEVPKLPDPPPELPCVPTDPGPALNPADAGHVVANHTACHMISFLPVLLHGSGALLSWLLELAWNLKKYARDEISWDELEVSTCCSAAGCFSGTFAGWGVSVLAMLGIGCIPGVAPVAAGIGAAVAGLLSGVGVSLWVRQCVRSWWTKGDVEANLRAVVNAMQHLGLTAEDPESLELDTVRSHFKTRARESHPDKCHKREKESASEFETRRRKKEDEMTRLNHDHEILEAFIKDRESPMWKSLSKRIAALLSKVHKGSGLSAFGC